MMPKKEKESLTTATPEKSQKDILYDICLYPFA
jgi:hypothetical protein